MKRSVVAALVLGLPLLQACGSGPVYRGAPPPGKTDAEYKCELSGQCVVRSASSMHDGTKDASNPGKF
jgi:hypothetical protein